MSWYYLQELARPHPGILTNSDYGRHHKEKYLDERFHRVAYHQSFYRTRGVDGTKYISKPYEAVIDL